MQNPLNFTASHHFAYKQRYNTNPALTEYTNCNNRRKICHFLIQKRSSEMGCNLSQITQNSMRNPLNFTASHHFAYKQRYNTNTALTEYTNSNTRRKICHFLIQKRSSEMG